MKRPAFRPYIAFSACFLLVSTLFVSCKWKGGGAGTDHGQSSTETRDIVSECQDSLHIANMPDGPLHIEYDIRFLKSDGLVADSINATIAQFLVSGRRDTDIRQAIMNGIVDEEKSLLAEMQEYYDPDDETYGQQEYTIVRTGRFDTDALDSVIVYKAAIDMYTGGAHGTYTPFTLNFSRRTGCRILPSDIFNMKQEQAILDLMMVQLLRDNDCTTREELMERTCLLTLGDLSLTPNFQLGSQGVTFCFGQYEIAPYSAGITYLTLGYDVLEPYLKKQ